MLQKVYVFINGTHNPFLACRRSGCVNVCHVAAPKDSMMMLVALHS